MGIMSNRRSGFGIGGFASPTTRCEPHLRDVMYEGKGFRLCTMALCGLSRDLTICLVLYVCFVDTCNYINIYAFCAYNGKSTIIH